MKIIVSNIQRFSLHDGPGIRTTVFLKGCNLKCPWCSNPENMNFSIERYSLDNIEGIYGKEYTVEELYNEIIKDTVFFDRNGGVTFSGGECLWQFDKIEPLLKKLKDNGINICIETALNVPTKYLDIALKYVDLYYVDMKILDEKNQYLINANKELYLFNLHKLLSNKKEVIIRIPIVKGYTYTKDNLENIIKALKGKEIKKVEIFKIHCLAKAKYKSLNRTIQEFGEVSDDDLIMIKNKLKSIVKNIEIVNI